MSDTSKTISVSDHELWPIVSVLGEIALRVAARAPEEPSPARKDAAGADTPAAERKV